MAALCVSDQAGSHGAVGPPAPLKVTHGVLVQVACCHQRAARSQPSRRELQTALGCQETGRRNDREEILKTTKVRVAVPGVKQLGLTNVE